MFLDFKLYKMDYNKKIRCSVIPQIYFISSVYRIQQHTLINVMCKIAPYQEIEIKKS